MTESWQPIDTAPRDGTPILAWFRGAEERSVIVHYVGYGKADPWPWATQLSCSGEYHRGFITHWMRSAQRRGSDRP